MEPIPSEHPHEVTDMTDKQVQNAQRNIASVIKGMPATDGAGVELTRVIGQPAPEHPGTGGQSRAEPRGQ